MANYMGRPWYDAFPNLLQHVITYLDVRMRNITMTENEQWGYIQVYVFMDEIL